MMTSAKKIALLFLLTGLALFAKAQVKIGDNPTVINRGSILELESTNKGLLFPRVNLVNTTTWSLAASSTPVAGMMVYNIKTTAAGFSGSSTYPAIAGDGTGIYYWEVFMNVFDMSYDLIIIDIYMPGNELLEAFVEQASKHTKVIIFSNLDKEDKRAQNLIRLGADAFLAKSAKQAEVISILQFVLSEGA